ncbi:PREDICTED: uncharacterized protein LOC108750015 [Trachymyrmex septentrionalis]|uniref:uncharacterized protein LOC108750015 n=1 Tax=Trachymyrmex septentrionalis TaxID=34720 RepID=UPI00084F72F6|nr:PREDICTED: uncharacterized protein LOC108750015 [Trachymyrmex septentrionalis]
MVGRFQRFTIQKLLTPQHFAINIFDSVFHEEYVHAGSCGWSGLLCIREYAMQLRQERTEERRKLFKIAEKRHTVAETPLSKWKKILPALPQVKISQNSETVQKANVQISIGNVSTVEIGTVENKDLMNDTEEYSRQDQVLSNCDNEQRVEEQNGLISNDTSSNRSKLTNVVGCSWDSSSNKQSVTVPEIQVNNEEKIVSDVCANIELDGVPENGNQETT